MTERTPSRRERARPAEILLLAAGVAIFVGLGVLMSTRDLLLALEFFGGAFIVSIVVVATLLLTVSGPTPPTDAGDRSGPEEGGGHGGTTAH